MNSNEPPTLFWVFMAVWVALGAIGWWFFARNRDPKLKRRVLRWGMIGVGLLFTVFTVLMSGEAWVLLFVVPAVALISYLNIRLTKFCPSCGAMLYNYNWFSRMNYCSRCGASLDMPKKE
jgi:hypothetical protein